MISGDVSIISDALTSEAKFTCRELSIVVRFLSAGTVSVGAD